MPTPTAATVRARSKVDLDLLGYADDDELQILVDEAIALVQRWTGQRWGDDGTYSNRAPASGTEPLAAKAVLRLVEFEAYRSSEDVQETLSDFDLISSFSAGDYSETRRSGKDAQEARMAVLKGLLWPLMDYDHQDDWVQLEGGPNAPAFGVTEVDWGARTWDTFGYGGTPEGDPWPLSQ
jgi:hypothetical protein